MLLLLLLLLKKEQKETNKEVASCCNRAAPREKILKSEWKSLISERLLEFYILGVNMLST